MRRFLIILITLLPGSFLLAQGEIDNQEKIFYRNERTFGLLLNSNGYGLNYRYAKRIDAFQKTLYEIELDYLKHPKEEKWLTENNRNIIFGKLNSVVSLKCALGYQKEMFRKRDIGGISIRYFTNYGPALAFLKPIYYEYYDISNPTGYYVETFQKHTSMYILGRAPFTTGFRETTLSPGIYGKFGFSFEYSRIDAVFHALETSIAIDAYARKIEIMDTPVEKLFFLLPDNRFFLTLTISYRFGRVIDAKFSPKQNEIDGLITK